MSSHTTPLDSSKIRPPGRVQRTLPYQGLPHHDGETLTLLTGVHFILVREVAESNGALSSHTTPLDSSKIRPPGRVQRTLPYQGLPHHDGETLTLITGIHFILVREVAESNGAVSENSSPMSYFCHVHDIVVSE
ncbi:hypothetical protein AVEN_145973-1 [Araneus ventricosus]|uniref:Uncharacterized protein n=1 Tax=Araneus ventricosus TaxID=182803 RepID=A0A4Y2MZA3_ARAVE|nr:hypothetical protein AVEN_145973-1 [Araneus ventricosus]